MNLTRIVAVDLPGRSYAIHIGPGLLDSVPGLLAPLLGRPRVAIVTEDRVAARHLPRLQAALAAAGIAEVTLILPLTRVDDPSSLPEQVPGIVFIPGGLVQRDRYVWLARHLGSRGFAVVIPEYTAWLAFFEPGIAAAALDHLEVRLGERLGNTAMMGHSLGGVMAVKGLMADERLDALVLLASQADEADAIADENRPLLTLPERWMSPLDHSACAQRLNSGAAPPSTGRWIR